MAFQRRYAKGYDPRRYAPGRTPPVDFRLKKNRVVRDAVYKRDSYTCQDCRWRPSWRGGPPEPPGFPYNFLTLDHIVPRVRGGPTTVENCQTLCLRCNAKKGAR